MDQNEDEINIPKDDKGLLNGKGEIKYKNGNIFTGEFESGKMKSGTIKYKNGNMYQGNFNEKQQFHGKGIFNWANGDKYEGEYVENYKEGEGIFTYKNGTKYQGFFKKGKVHGKGIYIDEKNKTHKTVFVQGKRKWTKDEIKRQKCDAGHWVIVVATLSGHRCNICQDGRESLRNQGGYRCHQCDFDRCYSCYNSYR